MDFETLATGYCFLEAPRADDDGLWFSDILLGGIYRWRRGRDVECFLPDRRHIGGIAINEDGAVISSGPGGLAWLDPATGRTGTILQEVDGEKIGINDMLPDGRGGLFFGTLTTADAGVEGAKANSLYRVDRDGHATLLVSGLKIANGIGLNPDGRRLYHSESLVGTFVYDVLPDGNLGEGELFWDQPSGDGLAVDCEGGVWIACFNSGEIVRLLADGSVDRRIALPHNVVSSLCFGGPDSRDLYVTTGGNDGVDAMLRGEQPPREASLFHARSDIPGLPVARTQFRLPQESAATP
jgi:sugar lactone lactonase YvrE